ncbi:MAG: tripartite tricarboxylate transporter substrate binding protein [Xanthobacteraceae bacterium]|nr:tripartite tricarboxylate transporter substrate binding protein [Xanthobacteraceae bacterium]
MIRTPARLAMTALLACAASAPFTPAQAQPYPSRPITIVVALAAGTGMDIVVRSYADKLSQTLGRPVIIENRPGNAGLAAVDGALKAPADGYTLLAATSSAMAIRPTMFKKPPYDPNTDFVPLSHYLKSPFVLVVNPDLPIKSVPDLIAYAKANPGKVAFSSTSIGGAPHLSGEYINQRFGVQMTHVPYKISPQAIQDVAAGHVQLTFAEAAASLELIRGGKLRALAVTSTTRLGTLPDVPPFAEASGIPDFEAVSWHMLFARAGTPKDIVDKLHAEMSRIIATPELQTRMSSLGLIPYPPPPIAETQAYIKSEIDKWGGLVKSLGLAGTI